ncbi:MAG: acyltransferase family protein [Spirochaetales bacterium]|nr:acyltransferase family protein [Spirochaetales bacterium]
MNDKNEHLDYIPGIDGLRAVAVLAVIFYHAGVPFLKGGFTGVDIFFVISGYVIARSLAGLHGRSFAAYLSGFYMRRVLRILPALLVCLLVVMTASLLFIPPEWLNDIINKTGLWAFAAAGNFALVRFNDHYFSMVSELNPFLHTWSLGVEEQFYLVFPLLFWLWLKSGERNGAMRVLFRVLLPVLAVLSLVYAAQYTARSHDNAFYLLPGRFWELAAGALLFQVQASGRAGRLSGKTPSFVFAAGLAAIVAGFLFSAGKASPFPGALLPVAGALLMICGLTCGGERDGLPGKIFGSGIAVYIGRLSYSLYLWHWPVLVLLRWTCGFATGVQKLVFGGVTCLLAMIFYHCIEDPVRRKTFFRKQKNSVIIAGGLAVLLLALGTAGILVKNQLRISLSVTRDRYIWCSGWYRYDEQRKTPVCNPEITGRRMFVLGDSHSAAYRTMLHLVSGELGFTVYEYERGGCDVLGLLEPMAAKAERMEHYTASLSGISALARPGDILFLASLRMPELSSRLVVVDTEKVIGDFFSPAAKRKRDEALKEADVILSELEALGLEILVDAPLPVLKAPPFRCSDWFNRMNPIAANGLTVERQLLLDLRRPVMTSLTLLQETHTQLHVWDPLPVLCPGEVFSAYDEDGLPLLHDGDHLSGNGNRRLVPSFRDKVLDIWQK